MTGLAPKAHFIPSLGRRPRIKSRHSGIALKARFKSRKPIDVDLWDALSALRTFLGMYLGRCPRLEMKRAFGADCAI